MRIAVISDIHANLPALEKVLEHAASKKVDDYWCLGDVVGYGAHPLSVLQKVNQHVSPDHWVLGNHEAMLGDILLSDEVSRLSNRPIQTVQTKNGEGNVSMTIRTHCRLMDSIDWQFTGSDAIQVILAHRKIVTSDQNLNAFVEREYTPKRKEPILLEMNRATFVLTHGCLNTDTPYNYIYPWSLNSAFDSFGYLNRIHKATSGLVIGMVGHTHVPMLLYGQSPQQVEAEKVIPGVKYRLESRLNLINPGSIGQPRDDCHCASYAILETDLPSITYWKVPYEWRDYAIDLNGKGYPLNLTLRIKKPALTSRIEGHDDWIKYFANIKQIYDE